MSKPARIGRFSIRNATLLRGQDLARVIMRDVIVFDARPDIIREETEYLADHPDFDPLPEGEQIPRYEPEIHAEDGDFRVVWKRKD